MTRREFTVENEYRYNRSGAIRWILAHVMRYPYLPAATVVMAVVANWLNSQAPLYMGRAFDHVLSPERNVHTLLLLSLAILGFRLGTAAVNVLRSVFSEFLAQLLERDTREELYTSLLGKSLTFHSRQRIGDLMARATNDVRQINLMFSPGLRLILSSVMSLILPIMAMRQIHPQLLIVPLLFCLGLGITLARYIRQLNPVAEAQREQFGKMNAGLAEAVAGIEVVKANAQEAQELQHFYQDARLFRDLFVRQGEIEARYLPLLVYYVALATAFFHALFLYTQGVLTIGQVIAYMGLLNLLRFPTFISSFSFTLVQLGIAGAERILDLIKAETELDENLSGHEGEIQGEVVFDHVSFAYNGNRVLDDVSFHAHPGETIAIVGQTGSGKTTLTRLINRIYDVSAGRVLVDGIDVRDWNLAALRSQVSTIEQDIFLFARSIADNIAFGTGHEAERAEIERAAREAQAHDFIESFDEGYETTVGERGVTLSGGQRQRVAIARAFLTDPRILILDDSTSAIDSATEDKIQAAMYRVQEGRTTFLITHRMSQIRWADRILVLRQGKLVDQGTHKELVRRCSAYRRIFARYQADLPPQEKDACPIDVAPRAPGSDE